MRLARDPSGGVAAAWHIAAYPRFIALNRNGGWIGDGTSLDDVLAQAGF